MAELIAIGKGGKRQSRQEIQEGETLLIGRAPRNGWGIPWDRLISREHANVSYDSGELVVQQLETARNPILLQGTPTRTFSVGPEEQFRIGDTMFLLRMETTQRAGDSLIGEHVFENQPTDSPFTNPVTCLQALCKMPELISHSSTNEEFAEQAVDLLLESLRGCVAAAVMQFDGDDREVEGDPTLLRWSTRGDEMMRFRPSRRLIRRAFDQQQSVVHLWVDDESQQQQIDDNFTMSDDLDWAFCTPIPVDATQKWCLYASGKRRFAGMREVRSPRDLIGELRLAELIAQFIGAIRKVRSLEQQQTEMRQFFSPAVIETLAGTNSAQSMEPRQGPVAVLFCDVRGFSRKVEEARDDLPSLLAQVSEALTAMTRSILKYEGVIADFQGDAALGFWGWPSQTPDAALLACRAALRIHKIFQHAAEDPKSPLHGFRVGIGVTYGEAIAGQIGSEEQIKVGVFGPVVNLAARLESLTKQVGVPILVDGGVVKEVSDTLSADRAWFRRLARLRPAGVDIPADIYSLIPTEGNTVELCDADRRRYEDAVEAVIRGDWPHATKLLQAIEADDPPTRFLLGLVENQQPPADWDGALSMAGKGELKLRK